MRYFSFVHAPTGEYVEIQISTSEKLAPNQGLWCGNKVVVSYQLYRSFPAGDNAAVKRWFEALVKVEPSDFARFVAGAAEEPDNR